MVLQFSHVQVFIFFFILVFSSQISNCFEVPHRNYRGYQVLRITPKNAMQLEHLRNIEKEIVYTPPFDIDFWRLSGSVNEPSEVMLNPSASVYLLDGLKEMGMTPEVLVSDLYRVLRTQTLEARNANDSDFFSTYRSIEEIHDYLDTLRQLNPQTSTIEVIGKSYEGRDLKVLIIGPNPEKKVVWIDGGHHAREWISPSTAMLIAATLSTSKAACDSGSPDCDEEMNKLLNTFEFRIFPVVNPDGYYFAHTNDRMWRKTRSDSGVTPWSLFCKGTDPNRNYDAKWGGEGSSGNPCAQTYAGRKAHSEPEIVSLTDHVSSIRSRILLFVSLHSYSQIMLLPYGHSQDIPEEYPEIEKLANIGAEAFRSRGTEYKVGSAARILYPASGTASDWAFGQGIKYSYTFELPDTGDQGFLLPAEKIKPVGEETWLALRSMLSALL